METEKVIIPLLSIIAIAAALFFLKDTLFSKEKEALKAAESFTKYLEKKNSRNWQMRSQVAL
ncbi:hypothetical protein OE903_12080 [Bacillus sp. B6(2022)]|nr:hypothetical protein [Bacillus sp. B6(2022)]